MYNQIKQKELNKKQTEKKVLEIQRCLNLQLFLKRRFQKLFLEVEENALSDSYIIQEALSVVVPQMIRDNLLDEENFLKKKELSGSRYKKNKF